MICPGCTHQFRAIPVNVQAELADAKRQGRIEALEAVLTDLLAPIPRSRVVEIVRDRIEENRIGYPAKER